MRVSALYATEKSSCMKQENVQITIEENCSTAKITIIPSMSSHPLGQSHSRLVTCMSILFQFSTVIMEMPGLRPLIRRTSSANLSLRPTMDRQICQPLDWGFLQFENQSPSIVHRRPTSRTYHNLQATQLHSPANTGSHSWALHPGTLRIELTYQCLSLWNVGHKSGSRW